MRDARRLENDRRRKSFDVICAGEALWKVSGVRLQPAGGPVSVALALANEGLRVGLATVLADDTLGRHYVERLAASGVDVAGVALTPARAAVMRVDAGGGASPSPREAEQEPPLQVPDGWSSRVLLLSGLSPVVSHAAALCKAARAARRGGAFVLLDFNAGLHVWAGRDPRTIQMLLREVDAARCSVADLAALGTDAAAVRAALRPGAVLVVADGSGGAVAKGAFGEVAFVPPAQGRPRAGGSGDACTAAICAELARPENPGESADARWARALRRGWAAS